jgi:hypothetical protein
LWRVAGVNEAGARSQNPEPLARDLKWMTMGFEQATISVEREKEFAGLKSAIKRAFSPEKVETFLKRLQRGNVRVRDWESVLGVLEKVGGSQPGETLQGLYTKLTVSDQAQIREFYLSRVEEVDPRLRTKFHKIYQYY